LIGDRLYSFVALWWHGAVRRSQRRGRATSGGALWNQRGPVRPSPLCLNKHRECTEKRREEVEVAIAQQRWRHAAEVTPDRNGSVDRATGSTSTCKTTLPLVAEDRLFCASSYTDLCQNSGSKQATKASFQILDCSTCIIIRPVHSDVVKACKVRVLPPLARKIATFCPHSCIYVFCVDLRSNSEYFLIQH